MKKSTILVILVIYLASIVAIGFFGMRVKVYDEIKYIKSIECSIESESQDYYAFTYTGIDKTTKNKTYQLIVDFAKAKEGIFENNQGETQIKNFIALNIIPYVTYDSGDIGNSKEENIVYSISNEQLLLQGDVSLSARGELLLYKPNNAFYIKVNPSSLSRAGSGAIISVFVYNLS